MKVYGPFGRNLPNEFCLCGIALRNTEQSSWDPIAEFLTFDATHHFEPLLEEVKGRYAPRGRSILIAFYFNNTHTNSLNPSQHRLSPDWGSLLSKPPLEELDEALKVISDED